MKRFRYIKPTMRFNPGTQKYEPELPLHKTGKRIQDREIMWKLIWVLIGISLMLAFFMFVLRFL